MFNVFIKRISFKSDLKKIYKQHERIKDKSKLRANLCKQKAELNNKMSRRQSLEVKEILIRLRSRLDMELAKYEIERSQYLTEA